MKDLQLALMQLQGARFCDIPPVNGQPTKGPRVRGWQDRPLTQESVPQGHNIGLLTGPASGMLAIDFDGPDTWQHFTDVIGIDSLALLSTTVTWASGRPGRAQMAFSVPEELWPVMTENKIAFGQDTLPKIQEGDDAKAQQVELRWSRCQSVMPPSVHPELGQPYVWLFAPETVAVRECPVEILEYYVRECQRPRAQPEIVDRQRPMREVNADEVNEILNRLRHHCSDLGHDQRLQVTWAVMSVFSATETLQAMRSRWPDDAKSRKYEDMIANYGHGGLTMGTVIHMIRKFEPEYRSNNLSNGMPRPLTGDQLLRHMNAERRRLRQWI